jgi:hypothetical protein
VTSSHAISFRSDGERRPQADELRLPQGQRGLALFLRLNVPDL